MPRTVLISTLAACFIAGAAHGQSALNIDFGLTNEANVYSGQGAAPDGGAFWNALDDATTDGGSDLLMDSLEAPTGVSVMAEGPGGGGAFLNAQEIGASMEFQPLMGDYLFISGTQTRTVTISGLTTGNTYDLYLYGQGDQSNQFSGFTVNGDAANRKVTAYDPGAPAGNDGLLAENIEYVLFSGVAPNASGQISILQDNGGAAFGGFNGLQLLGEFLPPPVPLNLQINTGTGAVEIQNNNLNPILFDSYVIETDQATLNDAGWNSLSDQMIDEVESSEGDYNEDGVVDSIDYAVWREGLGTTFESSDFDVWKENYGAEGGEAAGWDEATGVSASVLAEFYLGSSSQSASTLDAGLSFDLGTAFSAPGAEDGTLTFRYRNTVSGELVDGTVSFVSAAAAQGAPEPTTFILLGMLIAIAAGIRARRNMTTA